ncbi:MAG: sterol homeostasis protein [Thelocarpon impressellum]|nr:MAG: sterol homeostasis protein [Thelocarpon impressellum]
MPICIECRYPVHQLYTTYSKADDHSLGKGVRLTQCPRCKRFADKYVEHDFVVLFIDLVLIKPQVYRHLLFNRLGREDDRFDPSIVRLGILLLLFDVYLTWARIEKQTPSGSTAPTETPNPAFGHLAAQPIVLQYLFFLFLCLTESLFFHLTIRSLTHLLLKYPRPNSVSTALLVSSCTKLFPILMVIWDYDVPAAAKSVGWAVVVNNVEALEILLDCGYGMAALLAGTGAIVRVLVGWEILRAVGLKEGDRFAAVGDLVGTAAQVVEWARLGWDTRWGNMGGI